jgi:hypothetical protein
VVNLPVPTDSKGSGNPGDWIGRMVPVTIRRAGPHSLSGDAAI